MPIEIRRKNIECPKCKNPTIFDIGKKYVCGKCMSDIDKETMKVTLEVEDVFVSATGLHCEKSANPDVLTDPQVMVDTSISTVAM